LEQISKYFLLDNGKSKIKVTPFSIYLSVTPKNACSFGCQTCFRKLILTFLLKTAIVIFTVEHTTSNDFYTNYCVLHLQKMLLWLPELLFKFPQK
jgi:hypothetical protein